MVTAANMSSDYSTRVSSQESHLVSNKSAHTRLHLSLEILALTPKVNPPGTLEGSLEGLQWLCNEFSTDGQTYCTSRALVHHAVAVRQSMHAPSYFMSVILTISTSRELTCIAVNGWYKRFLYSACFCSTQNSSSGHTGLL